MFHSFKNLNLKKFNFNKTKFYLIDGITGSGKTTLAKILKQKYYKSHKIQIISKDLFLKSREKRILITKKNKNKKNFGQNNLQYDFKKYIKIVNLFKKQNKEKVNINKLYNRKTGKNNLTTNFEFRKEKIYIIEGIYVAKDFCFLPKNITKKIYIQSNIYDSLAEKLRRIRDKKVSISLVINEYINIHLYSYLHYMKKSKFDFIIDKKGKIKIFNKLNFLKIKSELIQFLKKHD